MSDTVTFARRYQGFADGALGGYAAGVAAQRIEGPAEANLRALPPLERELPLQGDGDRVVLRDDETVVLEVTASDFELEIPAPPTLKEAEAASRDLVHDHHPWPGCFTCGPGRAAGDGLRLFMGRAPGREAILAAARTPNPQLVADSELPVEFVWAALDCPTIWASWLEQDGRVRVPVARSPCSPASESNSSRRSGSGSLRSSARGRSHMTGANTSRARRSMHPTVNRWPAPSPC